MALSLSANSWRWPGWRHLPRDARDALFLLAVIGWTLLPHLSHLPWWCGLLAGVVLVWRASLALQGAALPGRWWLVAVLGVAAGLTFFSHGTLLGKDAGVTLLVVLMVLKTLELRARRDALVVFFLGFFLVLTNFLYSQSLPVAFAMLVSVWGLLTALVLAHMPVGRPALGHAARLSFRAAAFGVPVMLVLFLLFPRMGPLWAVPQDAAGKTGLSGTLSMGGVAELALDDSIAFRVRFDGPVPPQQALYWRGPVLSAFDGHEWRRGTSAFPARLQLRDELRLQGEPVRYEMTIEPSKLAVLPLLDATPDTPEAAPSAAGWTLQARPALEWSADRPLSDRVRLTATAWTRFEHGPRNAALALQDHLVLPPGYNPRTLAWAAELRREPRYAQADTATLVGAVLQHIRNQGYTYTLAPGTYGDERGQQAIDEFWLDRRQGFCEHFATAFVVVMRALDIPARIVTGYQGSDAALQDGFVVVRQSHAHAWAEVWEAGKGWVRVDPTAAVAPERVMRGEQLRAAPGLVATALSSMSPALLQQLREGWESLNNRWNQWVLNYSRSQQFGLLAELGFSAPSWQDLALLLLGLLSTAALAGAAWALWDRHRRDPWERLQSRVRERLATLGISAAPHEAPRVLARRVRIALDEVGEPLAQALEQLDAIRYGRQARHKPDPAWWSTFARAAALVPARRPGLPAFARR